MRKSKMIKYRVLTGKFKVISRFSAIDDSVARKEFEKMCRENLDKALSLERFPPLGWCRERV